VGRRVEQRRIEVEGLGREPRARIGKSVGVEAFIVHRQPDEFEAELRRDRAGAGIGEALRQDHIAGFGDEAEDAEQRGMRARCDEQAILRRHQRAAAEPVRGGVLVGLHAAKTLVTHQRDKIAPDRFEAVLHAVQQLRIVGLGRQVHREVDDLRMARHRGVHAPRRFAHEGAASDMGFDQAALLRLEIAARDGGEIDVEAAGKLALWRQPIGSGETAAANVLGDGIGDGEVARLVAQREVRRPVLHVSCVLRPNSILRVRRPVNRE
jgi:hypothetical protein